MYRDETYWVFRAYRIRRIGYYRVYRVPVYPVTKRRNEEYENTKKESKINYATTNRKKQAEYEKSRESLGNLTRSMIAEDKD
ncbi:hypothetical protein BELL_0108g00160 [Botrytis elliptica]|uniref:Uncharacterized protein n=1 Tax=Botrytis elliptica TaxID=278938 RepID=A0A4Z1JV19_9HELO|nr:hypothetical protein BELL_0108g00160 [Botrytis elliptica]